MSGARVRRGSAKRTRARPRSVGRVTVPKKLVAALPVEEASANRLAAWTFGLFAAAIGVVTLIALDVPAKAWTAAGERLGDAGFRVRSVNVTGVQRMDSRPVFEIAAEQRRVALPLVDVDGIRGQLLRYGWVKDARVSRRMPDTLVIDIVERQPAALWQNGQRLLLIDGDGVVLDRVKVSEMPDLPLLEGPGANVHSRGLAALLAEAPELKPQLESASWIGGRRWDLHFQTGETVSLPEGDGEAKSALAKFAKRDKSQGLLGQGVLRFDLRLPGKMIVRLPKAPNGAAGENKQES